MAKKYRNGFRDILSHLEAEAISWTFSIFLKSRLLLELCKWELLNMIINIRKEIISTHKNFE